MTTQTAPWRKFDAWPARGTHEERRAWCAARFPGWRHVALVYPDPRRWPEGRVLGVVVLRTPEGLMLLGHVKEWADGTLEASFTNKSNYPNVKYGTHRDHEGLVWFATEVWVTAPAKIRWAKHLEAVYTWLSTREELFHGIPWFP